MEKHVRKQQANIQEEEAQFAAELSAKESEQKPESEKSPSTERERANIESIGDIVQAIKAGDEEFREVAIDIGRKFTKIYDNISDIQNRIANIEMLMEAQQLSNVTILDKLAKIGMAFVTFVAKFGTKKDVDVAVDEVEEETGG